MGFFIKRDYKAKPEPIPKKPTGPYVEVMALGYGRGRYGIRTFVSEEHWGCDGHWVRWGKKAANRKAKLELAKLKIRLAPETWLIR